MHMCLSINIIIKQPLKKKRGSDPKLSYMEACT